MTYLWLSVIFLGAAVLVAVVALLVTRAPAAALLARWWLPVTATGLVALILTAVFDNVMIHSGLMTYAAHTTSGVLVGVAPVEDFAYPVAGLILLPSLWLLFGRRRTNDR